MIVLVSFVLAIGNRQGTMRLCFPCRAIRPVVDKLTGRGRLQPHSAIETEGNPTQDAEAGSPGAEVIVTLASTSIAVNDLGSLRVGDIILTETPADSLSVVSIDGDSKFRAKPAACQGRKAVVLSLPGSDAPS